MQIDPGKKDHHATIDHNDHNFFADPDSSVLRSGRTLATPRRTLTNDGDEVIRTPPAIIEPKAKKCCVDGLALADGTVKAEPMHLEEITDFMGHEAPLKEDPATPRPETPRAVACQRSSSTTPPRAASKRRKKQHDTEEVKQEAAALVATVKKEIMEAKLDQDSDPDIWWRCTVCDFVVRHSEDHIGNGCIRSRRRLAHLTENHPDLDPLLPEHRIYQRPRVKGRPIAENLMSELGKRGIEGRKHNAQEFINKYKGQRKLSVKGYSLVCDACGFHTKFQGVEYKVEIPKVCLYRGGASGRSAVRDATGRRWCRRRTARDGVCLWNSLAALLQVSAGKAKRVTLYQLDTMRHLDCYGETFERRVLDDSWMQWPDYLRSIRRGTIWPGRLEVEAAAHFFDTRVQVFAAENGQLADLLYEVGPAGGRSIQMQYIDNCHYEPLVMDSPKSGTVAAPLAILYANVSSYNRHAEEVYAHSRRAGADVVLLTETRLRNFQQLHADAARKGFGIPLTSNPRPWKIDGSGPREGGLAAMAKVPITIRKLDLVQDEMGLSTSPDDLLHFRLPYAKERRAAIHVLLCYHHRNDAQGRAATFEYGASLGKVPVVIIGDFNNPASVRKAGDEINAALSTGLWTLLLDEGAATTHKGGVRGRDADLAFANPEALPLILSCEVDYNRPFVNHFGIIIRMKRLAATPRVWQPKATRRFRCFDEKKAESMQHTYADTEVTRDFQRALGEGDLDRAWTSWSSQAEQALIVMTEEENDASPCKFRAKGSAAAFSWRFAWHALPLGEVTYVAKIVARLRRLLELKKRGEQQQEQEDLVRKIRKRWEIYVECLGDDPLGKDFGVVDLETLIKKVGLFAEKRRKLDRRNAILRWRDRITSSFAQACKWLRNKTKEAQPLQHLDDKEGLYTTDSQDLASELLYRCKQKFEMDATDNPEAVEEILRTIGIKIQWEVEDITAKALLKACAKKLHGAAGLDGWTPKELSILPAYLWQWLADLFNKIERGAEWPGGLAQAVHVALLKDVNKISDYPKVRIRLIAIMPVVVRAWDALRAANATRWLLRWAPAELHGGVPGKGVGTATTSTAMAFAEGRVTGRVMGGVSLDYTEAFDRLPMELTFNTMHRLGYDFGITDALKRLYNSTTRYVRTLHEASAGPFFSRIGLIQGLASSVTAMNMWMSIYVLYVKIKTGHDVWDHHFITMTVYLDDRNVMADSVPVLSNLLKVTQVYDSAIGACLNLPKTQLYGEEGMLEELRILYPVATVRRRAWCLGAPTTTGAELHEDPASEAKVRARYTMAIKKAVAAAALPYDMRLRAIASTVPSTYGFGAECYDVWPALDKQVLKAMYDALSGGTRICGSRLVMWTVLTKGHTLHPWYVKLRQLTAFMKNAKNLQEQRYRQAWEARPSGTPFEYLTNLLKILGATWTGPTTFTAKALKDDEEWDLDFDTAPKSQLDHGLREIWRAALYRQKNARRDLDGARRGIDKKATMHWHDHSRDFYRRGWVRTLLLGDMRTPARMKAAGFLRTAEAACPGCPLAADGNGHRLVCHLNEDIRRRYGFEVEEIEAMPTCLSRCGLLPEHFHEEDFKKRADLASRVQNMQIDIHMRCYERQATAAVMELATLRMKAKRKVTDIDDHAFEDMGNEVEELRACTSRGSCPPRSADPEL